MLNEIKKIFVIIKRDMRVYFTYKLAVSMAFLSILFNFFYMVLFGSMFEAGVISVVTQTYGANFNYISYILIGSIGWGFMWSIMSQTSESIRSEMELGTLESLMLTPTSIYTMIVAYTLFGCFFGFLSIIGLLLIGLVFFDINVLATMTIFTPIVLVLSIILMTGFGMILGGLTLWIKNIGETAPLIQSVAMFFCGVYFPIAILPGFLKDIAPIVPFYWSIEGLRQSLNPQASTSYLINCSLILVFLCVIFLIIGAYVLHRGLMKAKKDGSLSFY